MKNKNEIYTIEVTENVKAQLDELKQTNYKNVTTDEMLRDLIKKGLEFAKEHE